MLTGFEINITHILAPARLVDTRSKVALLTAPILNQLAKCGLPG